jgi:hypothetical protein
MVNTVVFGFRGAQNIGIYAVFAPRVLNNHEHTTYLILVW